MNKFKHLLTALFLVGSAVVYGQTITGTVVDESGALPGADVIVKGTSVGTSTDFNGKFVLDTKATSGEVEISFIGYTKKTISFNVAEGATQDLGEVSLTFSTVGLEEIQVVAAVAIGRKTPVAVSTVKAEEIETKLGNQEFPEALKSTPGIYATKQGGGFGDARVNIRGFNSENVAVLINGIPVNDMENGRVYWSNWAGLADVTSQMQVQRGLGAARVAVPSIGGTINVITKTTDADKGGAIGYTIGNDGYEKLLFKASTGLMENGFAATVLGSRQTGNGFVDGTEFEGFSYFVNLSKRFNDKHTLAFSLFGAKQRHGQRQNRHTIETFQNSERGIRYNSDWGYLNGQITHVEDNFYNKPQASLNHYWTIDDNTSISNVLYASFGTGGGGGTTGDLSNKFEEYRVFPGGPIDLDRIMAENVANGGLPAEAAMRASRNDHNWVGLLSTLNKDLSENLKLLAGLDIRYYHGKHYQTLTNLLGASHAASDNNVNDVNKMYKVGDKYSYSNDGLVNWLGGFAQLEYDNDQISAFVNAAISNTGYKRIDFFNYLNSDAEQVTDWQNFIGFNIKGGANYNIDDSNNVFANIGYFEKAPGFDAVFLNYRNDINADAKNQRIFSAELGYGFKSDVFSANVNLYHTRWMDRTLFESFRGTFDPDNDPSTDNSIDYNLTANLQGVNAVHQGIEIDFVAKPTDKVSINGMISLGDWTWDNNLEKVGIFNEDQIKVDEFDLYIKDLKVGDAAQTTAALGVTFEPFKGTRIYGDFNYFDNLYADFDPNDRTQVAKAGVNSWKVPSYQTIDLGLNHKFQLAGFDAVLNVKVNNLLDTEYVSDAQDGSNNDAFSARVWYGAGRTHTVGLRLNF